MIFLCLSGGCCEGKQTADKVSVCEGVLCMCMAMCVDLCRLNDMSGFFFFVCRCLCWLVCVCLYVSVCVCVGVCQYVQMCVCVSVSVCVCVCLCQYVQMCVCVLVSVFVHSLDTKV